MPLVEELESQGVWLFKWRSYLPLPLLVATLALIPLKADPPREWWVWLCLAISVLGLVIRAATIGYAPKGTSGRNTGQQVAHHVNKTGLYSVVRHPLYVGNFFAFLGVVLYAENPWFALVYAVIFWIYYERIMYAEEAFLSQQHGESYVQWAQETPAFIPRLSGWQKSELPFSVVTVIAEEYASICAVIGMYGLLRLVESLFLATDPALDTLWAVLFGAGLVFYLIVRVRKKSGRFKTASRR